MKNCLVTLLIGLSLYACQKKVDPVICDLENRTILMSVLLDSLVTQKDLSLAQQQQLDSLNQTPVACLPDATDTIGFNEWQAALNSRWGRQLLGNYEPVKARPYLQTALAAYQRMYPDSVHRDILRMYHNVGLTYSRNRDFFLALSYFDSSDVWTPQVSPRPFIDTKMRKGQAYFALGEYNNALFHLQTAYDSSQQHDNFPTNLQLEIVHSLASTHRLMRQYGLAIELGEKTIRAAGIDRAQPNTLMLANLYLVIGNNWQDSMLLDPANKSVKSEAVWFTTTALRAYENLDDPLGISIAAGNLGELYRRAGDTDIADEILTQTIQQLKRLQADPALFSHLYLNRGETLVGKGNFKL